MPLAVEVTQEFTVGLKRGVTLDELCVVLARYTGQGWTIKSIKQETRHDQREGEYPTGDYTVVFHIPAPVSTDQWTGRGNY